MADNDYQSNVCFIGTSLINSILHNTFFQYSTFLFSYKGIMALAFRKKIISNFKIQGLQLSNDATTLLMEYLEPYSQNSQFTIIIDQITEAVQKQPLTNPLVTREIIEAAVEECNAQTDSDTEKALVVIDAFDIPSFTYDPDQKKFLSIPKESLKLHADAGMKAKLFRERFNILHQRTVRHDLFSPPVIGQVAQQMGAKFQLQTIEYLLSSSGLPDKVIILGMLIQLKEGKIHLEDLTGTVELDISQCVFHTGLFVVNSIVLVEGLYSDDIFHVGAIGFPPIETVTETRKYFGSVNFFGGPSPVCASESIKLQAMLEKNSEAMLVFISDLFLDDPKVLSKLGRLFSGYNEYPPVAFIFMGNFSSAPYGPAKYQKLKSSFKVLADLMLGYPGMIEKSQFYFIPGPLDPGPGNILPRPPIPSTLTSDLTQRVRNVHFCSNPCRIQFCTREIVLFREDILNKMSRHCVRFPTEGTDMSSHFAKSILSQAHLCPLPIHSSPTYWMYDHALRLYPLPDVIIIGDKCDPYSVSMNDCCIANPGSFPKSGFEFKVYFPISGLIEDSKIPE